MITFILNNEKISTGKPSGSSLLDFIRYEKALTGTKVGCREGDCGACTVLVGIPENRAVSYKSVVSCLTPLGNVHGKHVLTIEGLDTGQLSPVQKALVDHAAIQCGFCTPGFVMSLTACCLSSGEPTFDSIIASISGNICRCTGYKSIERAATTIAGIMKNKDGNDTVRWLVDNHFLPDYVLTIPGRLAEIPKTPPAGTGWKIAGGTDLMIQKADELAVSDINTFQDRKDLKGISFADGKCTIGSAVTITELGQSPELIKFLPGLPSCLKLIASEPVRNMATVAGNIVNASPIGDISILLLALDADVMVAGPHKSRIIPLKKFFLGYKKLDLGRNEHIRSVSFDCHPDPALFSFEKVSRRTHLDIASVNSAMFFRTEGEAISECHLSAGGVSSVPLYLSKTCEFLRGRQVNADTVSQAARIIHEEISPISDVRGSAEYKRILLGRLFLAHFLKLFPEKLNFNPELL